MSDFEAFADVRGYFVEHVDAAMQDLRVETARATKSYLVELLSSFAESQRIPELFTPLVEHIQHAVTVSGHERRARLQLLGDIALFLSGFFPDSFDRRGLSEAYVAQVGGRAYRTVAQVSDQTEGRLFVELAGRFRELAAVLDEVRERTWSRNELELVQLYRRFCEERSPVHRRRLRRRGIVPPPDGTLPN